VIEAVRQLREALPQRGSDERVVMPLEHLDDDRRPVSLDRAESTRERRYLVAFDVDLEKRRFDAGLDDKIVEPDGLDA